MKLAAITIVGILAATALVGTTGASNFCPPQWTHVYFGYGVYDYGAQSVNVNNGQGYVYVYDTNTHDCDGNGVGADFDGEYESGYGGAFFGYGPWANEFICNYGLNVHGGNVVVQDAVFGAGISFWVGEDDQNGPIIITDPSTGQVVGCQTDGVISPSTDADDCLSVTFVGVGATCGSGGGDGGFWVILISQVGEDGGSISGSNPPIVGTITAF